MTRSAALAAAFWLLACETPPERSPARPAAPAVRTSGEDYRLPERIGAFTLQRFSDFAEAEAGFMAKYAGPDPAQRLDFFVYSARNAPAEISLGDLLGWEYAQTKRQIEASLPQAGWPVALADERAIRVDTPRGAVDALVATYQAADAAQAPIRSVALLALVGDDFVKMRATRTAPRDEAAEAALAEAQRAFFAGLAPREAAPDVDYATHIRLAPNADPHCGVVALALYGALLERALAEGHTLHTLEREAGLSSGVAEFLAQREGPACTDPALLDLVAVQRAGFVREYVWTHRRASFWPDPGDLRSEAFEAFWRERLGRRPPLGRPGVVVRFEPERAAPAGPGAE